jgi:hypothetical protein
MISDSPLHYLYTQRLTRLAGLEQMRNGYPQSHERPANFLGLINQREHFVLGMNHNVEFAVDLTLLQSRSVVQGPLW